MPELIQYDELRRILGLPNVRDEVLAMRARASLGRPWPGHPYVFHYAEYGPTQRNRPTISSALGVHLGGRPPSWASELVVDAAEKAGLPPLTRWQIDVAAAQLASTVEKRAPMGAAKDPDAAVEQWRAFVDAMNELARAAAALTAVPTTVFPPKLKPPAGPRIPRPSHTPPPWALNPERTRRTKNGGVDMRTPRV